MFFGSFSSDLACPLNVYTSSRTCTPTPPAGFAPRETSQTHFQPCQESAKAVLLFQTCSLSQLISGWREKEKYPNLGTDGHCKFQDLDDADDVVLLSSVLDTLVDALDILWEEASPLDLSPSAGEKLKFNVCLIWFLNCCSLSVLDQKRLKLLKTAAVHNIKFYKQINGARVHLDSKTVKLKYL